MRNALLILLAVEIISSVIFGVTAWLVWKGLLSGICYVSIVWIFATTVLLVIWGINNERRKTLLQS